MHNTCSTLHMGLEYQRMGCPCLLAEVHAMTTVHTLCSQWCSSDGRSTDHTLCETRHMAYSMHTCSGAFAHTHAHVSTHTHTHTPSGGRSFNIFLPSFCIFERPSMSMAILQYILKVATSALRIKCSNKIRQIKL